MRKCFEGNKQNHVRYRLPFGNRNGFLGAIKNPKFCQGNTVGIQVLGVFLEGVGHQHVFMGCGSLQFMLCRT